MNQWNRFCVVAFAASISAVGIQAFAEPKIQVALQRDPSSSFYATQFSPDGRWLLAREYDAVDVYQPSTHKLITIKHQAGVGYAAFSPDSRFIVTTSADGTARFTDLMTGAERAYQHSAPVVHAAFSPDGRYLATASLDRSFRLIDLRRDRQFADYGYSELTKVAFSPNSRFFAAASVDGELIVLDTTDELPLKREKTAKNPLLFTWTEDGRRLVAVGGDQFDSTAITIFTIATGHSRRILHQGTVRSAGLSKDGNTVVTATTGNEVYVVDLRSGNAQVLKQAGSHSLAKLSPNGKALLSTSWNPRLPTLNAGGVTRLRTLSSGKETVFKHAFWLQDARFDSSGRYVALAHESKEVLVVDLQKNLEIRIPVQGVLTNTDFSPDSRSLVIAAHDGMLRIVDLAQGWEAMRLCDPGAGPAQAVCLAERN